MKFLLALPALSLIAVGCGQSSRNSPAPVAPTTEQQGQNTAGQSAASSEDNENLKQSLQAAADQAKAAIPVPDQTANKPDVSGMDMEGDPAAANLEQQIGFQQAMLYKEDSAMQKAIKDKNSSVHLGSDFMDMVSYGVSTGFLSWDFMRRLGVGESRVARATQDTAVVTERAAGLGSELGASALKIGEGVSAAILGIFAVGKTVAVGKDVVVYFSDTNEIRAHRAKVREAEKNLANAKANLAAIYYPQPQQQQKKASYWWPWG